MPWISQAIRIRPLLLISSQITQSRYKTVLIDSIFVITFNPIPITTDLCELAKEYQFHWIIPDEYKKSRKPFRLERQTLPLPVALKRNVIDVK